MPKICSSRQRTQAELMLELSEILETMTELENEHRYTAAERMAERYDILICIIQARFPGSLD